MKRITIAILLSALFSSHAFAWTVTAGFNDGTPGNPAVTPDGFDSNAGDSTYVTNPALVLEGGMSGSVSINAGETGFGRFGGSWGFPSALRQGDEIWFRVNVMYPTGWDFTAGSQGLKFQRIHVANAAGSNVGYHSTLIKGGSTGGLVTADTEIQGSPFWINNNGRNGGLSGLGSPVVRNRWHTYEMHIKFSSIEGQGIYRIWQDGELIFEDLQTPTLETSTDYSGFIYMYTYWNNGAPRSQTSYIDDVVITSDRPSNLDANGNPYIGVGSYTIIAPPNPPIPQ